MIDSTPFSTFILFLIELSEDYSFFWLLIILSNLLIAMSYNVVIDNREKYSRKINALKFFKSKQDYVKIDELQIGDFLFNDTVVFEYKDLSDFVKSVKNRRVFNQAKDQSLVFDYHFVIIVSTSYECRKYFNKLKYSGQSNYILMTGIFTRPLQC